MKLLVLYSFLCLLLASCFVHDVPSNNQAHLHIYTDNYLPSDSLVYDKFSHEENVKIHVHKLNDEDLLERLNKEKFNSECDILLLENYITLRKLYHKGLLYNFQDEKVFAYDKSYRSKSGAWVALSKTPIVIVKHEKDSTTSIKNYYDLSTLKGNSLVLQKTQNPTLAQFDHAINLILKNNSFSFKNELLKKVNKKGLQDDLAVLKEIDQYKQGVGIVRLSSYEYYQNEHEYNVKKQLKGIDVIFPNSRKKGVYFAVTSVAIYRYAKHHEEAKKFILFMMSRRAQYRFAAGRKEYPILNGIEIDYDLEKYKKVRGRFYKYKNKS